MCDIRYPILLLDADRTLFDFEASQANALKTAYEAAGFSQTLPYTPDILDCYSRINQSWWQRLERKECTKPQLQLGRFREFFRCLGLSFDPESFNRMYMEELGNGSWLLPHAEEVCRELAKTCTLYIVTNGNAVSQMSRLERSGLLPYVQDVFVSEDAGAAKPDVRYFDYAFSRIPGFEKERALLIGDSLTSDMLGAQNAGIDSMWYCPQGGEAPEGLSITYQVGSFEEMRRVLL